MEHKKFYELMKDKRKEIESLDISKDKKNNLYQLVDETIERYEKNKPSFFSIYTILIKSLESLALEKIPKN